MVRQKKFNPDTRHRVPHILALMVLFLLALSCRLWFVQAKNAYWYREEATKQHVGEQSLPALRGSILDRNREILAASLTLASLAADPSNILDKKKAAAVIARELKMPERQVRQLLNSPGQFVWLARKIPEPLAQRFEKLTAYVPVKKGEKPVLTGLEPSDREKGLGVYVLREPTGKRFYPKGRLGVHILGYTGIDDNGLDGIEGMFDPALKGTPGKLEAEMDREGRVIPNGWQRRQPAHPGNNVVLSLDESIQYLAEREIGAAVKRHNAKGAVCIVMDAKSGDILAMVNKPDYATKDFSKVPAGLRRNRAVTDAYEPGSTFKIVLAAAALDSGKVSMLDRFFCGTSIQVDGWTIHNADDGESSETGSEDLKGIICHSYNVGTTSVALRMGKRTYFDYICKFGFGRQMGIDLPGEAEGIVQPLPWANVTLATNSFGQGISVTPIQLVSAMQAVANGGVLMKPRIVREIVGQDGRTVKKMPPTIKRRVISKATSDKMRDILRNVVVNGTGKLAEVPGYPVAGKTGTASVVKGGVYGKGAYISSFLGFAPYNDPKVIILVKIEEPDRAKGPIWGGSVAGPVFRAIARETLWKLGVKQQPIVEKLDKKKEP